ncbi:MBL fold metallo-hydrolase [Streptomyces sp. NBC_00237]|uniref:MBL fold metallo-hydrolase n=1 Tax=Streptomyces sp. NBC_00237 TaxID=2975687 RepID=UPI0022565507|nr:MBL fold metallo-hydrolase [Streptomyces sp. NBC_00237]MCX5205641.1 MBL fold metallo-hydrolase [Streptomyces sp. NBC_00237]
MSDHTPASAEGDWNDHPEQGHGGGRATRTRHGAVAVEPSADRAVDVQFIGNATTLIRYGDVTLLTDPNFLHRGDRAYIGYGLSSRRLHDPALSIGELPDDIDAVILSHLHGDHWDRVVRRGLNKSLPVLTTPHAARRLRRWHRFGEAAAIPTWHSRTVSGRESRVKVTALPGRHAGGVLRALMPPVMGSLLEFGPVHGPAELRLYLSGDTLPLPPVVGSIARRCRDMDLAVLHLGGTRLPGGLLLTMDGDQGAAFAAQLEPRWVMPVHYEEYRAMKSPLSEFLDAARERKLSDRIVVCERGGHVVLRPGRSPVTEPPDGSADSDR